MFIFSRGLNQMEVPLHPKMYSNYGGGGGGRFCLARGLAGVSGAGWAAELAKWFPERVLWVDKIHFAPPKNPWNDESLSIPTKNGFPWLLRWVHSQYSV